MVTKYNRSRKDELMLAQYGRRYADYRKQWDTFCGVADSDFPLHISICNNYSCNLKCRICLVDDKFKKGSAVMPESLVERIFSEITEHNAPSVNIGSFTEPMATAENFEYILMAASKSSVMDIFVHTNGIYLTEEAIEKILDSRVNVICISLDAATPETYKSVRGASFLDKIEGNIRRLMDIKERRNLIFPLIRLSFCRNSLNIHEKDVFYDKWKDSVDLIEFQNYLYREDINIPADERFGKLEPAGLCREPFRRCDIVPEGDVLCCCTMRTEDTVLGNLREYSIHELWNGKKIKRIRRSLVENKGLNDTCDLCLNSWYVYKGE